MHYDLITFVAVWFGLHFYMPKPLCNLLCAIAIRYRFFYTVLCKYRCPPSVPCVQLAKDVHSFCTFLLFAAGLHFFNERARVF